MTNYWKVCGIACVFSLIFSSSVLSYREDAKTGRIFLQENSGKIPVFGDISRQFRNIAVQKTIIKEVAKVSKSGVKLHPKVPICGEDYDYVLCRCPNSGRVVSKF